MPGHVRRDVPTSHDGADFSRPDSDLGNTLDSAHPDEGPSGASPRACRCMQQSLQALPTWAGPIREKGDLRAPILACRSAVCAASTAQGCSSRGAARRADHLHPRVALSHSAVTGRVPEPFRECPRLTAPPASESPPGQNPRRLRVWLPLLASTGPPGMGCHGVKKAAEQAIRGLFASKVKGPNTGLDQPMISGSVRDDDDH
jgi:hypothetical protein